MTGEIGDKPMVQGKSSMQKFWGRIHWDDERLTQLRRVTEQPHPHPYDKDIRGSWGCNHLHRVGKVDQIRASDLLKRSRQDKDG